MELKKRLLAKIKYYEQKKDEAIKEYEKIFKTKPKQNDFIHDMKNQGLI